MIDDEVLQTFNTLSFSEKQDTGVDVAIYIIVPILALVLIGIFIFFCICRWFFNFHYLFVQYDISVVRKMLRYLYIHSEYLKWSWRSLFLLNRQKTKKEIQGQEDLNPVYGLYYFEDGQQIDDKNAEAIDENQDYENWQQLFQTWPRKM